MSDLEALMAWVTAGATSVAALTAVIAVIVSAWTVRQDRGRQILRDRHALAVDLLAAFEELQGASVAEWQYEMKVSPLDKSRLSARMIALLHASSENLPITR